MIKEEIDFGTAVQGAVDYLDNNIIGNNWNNTMLIVIPKLEHT